MDSSLVQSLQEAVDGLQAAAETCQQGQGAIEGHSWDHSLQQLSSCVSAVLQHHAGVVQALEDRAVAERALRNVIANKDAEAARLKGEINRLQAKITQEPTMLQETAAAPAADQEGQQSDAAADPEARQAVLDAAVAARDKPTAVVHELQSEVSACQSRIAALEAELAAAAAEHSSRLSQQQKAFLAKLEQLRLVHNQQLAAASQEAKHHQQQQQAHHVMLEKQLNEVKSQQLRDQERLASLQQKLQQQEQASKQQDNSSKQDQQPAQAALRATSKEAAKAAAAAEVMALQQMEVQLTRLSSTVKSFQAERDQLRRALLAGSAERQTLQQQVQELTVQLQGWQQKQGVTA